jgi:hypothetical protein
MGVFTLMSGLIKLYLTMVRDSRIINYGVCRVIDLQQTGFILPDR